MVEYNIQVSGMSCKSCETLVQDVVTRLDGVESVSADAQANQVVIKGTHGMRDRINQAINETGYSVRS